MVLLLLVRACLTLVEALVAPCGVPHAVEASPRWRRPCACPDSHAWRLHDDGAVGKPTHALVDKVIQLTWSQTLIPTVLRHRPSLPCNILRAVRRWASPGILQLATMHGLLRAALAWLPAELVRPARCCGREGWRWMAAAATGRTMRWRDRRTMRWRDRRRSIPAGRAEDGRVIVVWRRCSVALLFFDADHPVASRPRLLALIGHASRGRLACVSSCRSVVGSCDGGRARGRRHL